MLKILFTSGGSAGMEALWRLYDGVYEVHFADAILDAINPVVPAKNRHKISFGFPRDPEAIPQYSQSLQTTYARVY